MIRCQNGERHPETRCFFENDTNYKIIHHTVSLDDWKMILVTKTFRITQPVVKVPRATTNSCMSHDNVTLSLFFFLCAILYIFTSP